MIKNYRSSNKKARANPYYLIGGKSMERVKQKMENARLQRGLLQSEDHANTDQPYATPPGSQGGIRKKRHNTIFLLGTAIAWIVTLIAAWWVGSSITSFDVGLNSPGNSRESRINQVAELKNHIATSMELRKHLDDLNRRVQLLDDSIANAEANFTRILVMTDSMPAPASGLLSVGLQQPLLTGGKSVLGTIEPATSSTPDIMAISNARASKLPSVSARMPDAVENDAPDYSKQGAVNTATVSPWVVNLASLPSKADADRFVARARSKDIQAEEYAVIIKGKEYWRVQATGYTSVSDARYQGEIIKKKLGLKDVWITKR